MLFRFCLTLAVGSPVCAKPESTPGIAVLRGAAWVPGDPVRNGAGELAVLVAATRLQRAHRTAGLVAVCDRHGHLRSGGERALRQLVFSSFAVVKLVESAAAATDPHPGFLFGGTLSTGEASAILERCLTRHGPPPASADPTAPTSAEISALLAHLAPFQAALDAARAAVPQ
ncbi:MAG: hypothetical protein JNL39_04860 [Opitutaceae bacterium]|nr:hypothetical protein [Opitutaceae bacterium]